MAKARQLWIKLISSADTGFFYVTHKNPKKNTEKLTLRKYDLKRDNGQRVISRWVIQNLQPQG